MAGPSGGLPEVLSPNQCPTSPCHPCAYLVARRHTQFLIRDTIALPASPATNASYRQSTLPFASFYDDFLIPK